MDEETLNKLLDASYDIKLKGSALAYVLSLLATEQRRLTESIEQDITDNMEVTRKMVNEVIGNSLLLETHKAAGKEFMTTVLGVNEQILKSLVPKRDWLN